MIFEEQDSLTGGTRSERVYVNQCVSHIWADVLGDGKLSWRERLIDDNNSNFTIIFSYNKHSSCFSGITSGVFTLQYILGVIKNSNWIMFADILKINCSIFCTGLNSSPQGYFANYKRIVWTIDLYIVWGHLLEVKALRSWSIG